MMTFTVMHSFKDIHEIFTIIIISFVICNTGKLNSVDQRKKAPKRYNLFNQDLILIP